MSRYFEYKREYIYREKNDVPFYQTEYLYILFFEIVIVIPIQYPKINDYMLYKEFGSPILIPFSSILAALSFVRVFFVLKLFKHLTRWTNSRSERVCEKYVCRANTSFAFKAFQKENPFTVLFLVFIMSCYCLGLAVKTFELYYWENISPTDNSYQNWNYQWNAMWFVFVTMTTVGYGDFYPKTQLGRFVAILAALVGVYFVSMLMVFMTQKSVKNENEEKAFKLITRLEYRNKNRHLHSMVIHHFLKMVLVKNKKKNEEIQEKEFQIEMTYNKRCIITIMQEIKENDKYIRSCDFIPTKEQLLDISEKIDAEIKGIHDELITLRGILINI